jgi:hypothetical protein
LDRHVKIYDISSYQVVHTLDYPNAVLSLDVSVSIPFPSDHSESVLLCYWAPSASSQNNCLWFTVTYKIFFFKNYQNIGLWLILCD